VCPDVLLDHLLLLERFEAVHADIAGGRVQRAVDRRRQVPVPCLALASGLDPASFDHACEQVPSPSVCALHNPGQFGCHHLAFAKELGEYLEFLAGSH
jgi:hypothetical protein